MATQVGADTEITGIDVATVDTGSRALGTGARTGLVAAVAWTNGPGTVTISSFVFDPTGVNLPFTQLGHSGSDYCADLWYRAHGTDGGTGIFRLTASGNGRFGISVTEWTDVDQTTPMDGFTGSGTSNGANPSRSVTSRNGDVVIDALRTQTTSPTVGAGQTQQMNVSLTSGFGSSSSEASTGASVTMSWTVASAYYCHAGGNLRTDTGGGGGGRTTKNTRGFTHGMEVGMNWRGYL